MSIYAIGDLHLSLNSNKSMEVFGGAWKGYLDKIGESFSQLNREDTVVLCGDSSWGMSLAEAEQDFAFLNSLPGKKLLLKGNHDYWWNTAAKMKNFFEEKGFDTLDILHNNFFLVENAALCGTRGWFYEEPESEKVYRREVMRLERSLQEGAASGAAELMVFLHYPPLCDVYSCPDIVELLDRYEADICCYGHLHSYSHRHAFEGFRGRTRYRLVSSDYLNFKPVKIL